MTNPILSGEMQVDEVLALGADERRNLLGEIFRGTFREEVIPDVQLKRLASVINVMSRPERRWTWSQMVGKVVGPWQTNLINLHELVKGTVVDALIMTATEKLEMDVEIGGREVPTDLCVAPWAGLVEHLRPGVQVRWTQKKSFEPKVLKPPVSPRFDSHTDYKSGDVNDSLSKNDRMTVIGPPRLALDQGIVCLVIDVHHDRHGRSSVIFRESHLEKFSPVDLVVI